MYSRHGRDSNMNVMGTYAAFARGNQHACGEFLPAMGGGREREARLSRTSCAAVEACCHSVQDREGIETSARERADQD